MISDNNPNTGSQTIRQENDAQRELLFKRLLAEAAGFGLEVDEMQSSMDRPWGAYIRLRDSSVEKFLNTYWTDIKDRIPQQGDHRLAPKYLLVAPGSRLSLQYHHRRGEYWRVLSGPVKISLGQDGTSMQERTYNTGDAVRIPCGHWHRLAGMSGWAVIAELWDHTDPANPSDENDIVRVEDDFSRKTE